ncbi:hypothetical protein [Aestuariivita sp.]|jgi:outer membrane protein|uniref:hypothetical protein n=1 Tax=Aestuariivita sp. TaxID=1872407 RepID=UPI00216ED5D6|nr:hypothetical protein [Aestuariivita sp.]MCE8006862.1 hypothetical protein [Aestuariivita sp.]
MTYRLALASIIFVTTTFPAQAQMQLEGFSVGIAVTGGQNAIIGDDDAMALPLLRYDSDRFSVGLPDGVRVTVFENDGLRFSGIVSP